MTESQLSEIEAEAADLEPNGDGATVLKLIAEVRRLRSLFTAEDAIGCEVAGNWMEARCNDPEGKRQLRDLSARIRQAIGETREAES